MATSEKPGKKQKKGQEPQERDTEAEISDPDEANPIEVVVVVAEPGEDKAKSKSNAATKDKKKSIGGNQRLSKDSDSIQPEDEDKIEVEDTTPGPSSASKTTTKPHQSRTRHLNAELAAENIYIDRFFVQREKKPSNDSPKSAPVAEEKEKLPKSKPQRKKPSNDSAISERSEASEVADEVKNNPTPTRKKKLRKRTKIVAPEEEVVESDNTTQEAQTDKREGKEKKKPKKATSPPDPPTSVSEESLDPDLEALNFSSDDESGHLPDMTWIRDDGNTSPEEQGPTHHHHDPFSGIRHLLSLVTIMGRLPIEIYPNKENASGRISFVCRKKTAWWKRLDFYFITALLAIALTLCSMSVVHILLTELETKSNATAAQYSNFEKLLFQKHWLPVAILLLTLVIALAGNITFLLYGKKIISFVAAVGASFQELDFNNPGGRWWRTLGFLHIFLTIMDVIVLFSLMGSDTLAIMEGMQFETILYLRWFEDQLLLKGLITVAVWFVAILELYIYFLARNHLLFILILAKSITQSGHGWNSRIAHFLREAVPRNRKNVVHLGKPLSYEVLLKEHHLITKLVRAFSHAFPPTLLVFFGAKLLSICCVLFRAALAFLFDLKVDVEEKTINGTDIKYDATEEESVFQVGYYLSSTLLGLFVVTITISQVGETVMNGFGPVRRYGLLLAPSVKGRKFITTLFMSFNAKKPHVVKPGFWFYVDRGLFMSIVGTALVLFCIMIQCKIVNLVEIPIVLNCPGDKGGLCVKSYDNRGGDNAKEVFQKRKAVFPTTPQPLTKFSDPVDKIMNDCGLYCPHTRLYRMIPFEDYTKPNASSYFNDMVAAWRKDHLYDCLVDPYRFAATKQISSFYDCFGRGPYKTPWDAFHHFGLTFHRDSHLVGREPDVVDTSNTELAPPNGKCYQEDSSSLGFNPLEVCAVPYPFVQDFYDHLNNGAALKKITVNFTKDDLFPSTFTNDPACKEPVPEPTKQKNMVVQFSYKGQTIYRMIPYGHAYVSGAKPIPLDRTGKVSKTRNNKYEDETPQRKAFRLFSRPYAYFRPHYTANRSLGFYDCYGNELQRFDDCGGLPFYVYDKATKKMRPPEKKSLSFDPSKFCYEDATNAGEPYECGVPINLAREVCKEWKIFFESGKHAD